MIDLHSHTDRSDGTLTPAELVAEAKRVGVSALSITDHDTFAGYDAAAPYAHAAGIELICGVELSTRYRGSSVHLLGYFPDTLPSAEVREWLDFLIENRRDRNVRLIEKLRSLGVDISLAEVEKYGRTLTARPHFARVLVDKGYANDIPDAFDSYLDESARAYVQRREVSMQEALDRIAAEGGVSSLAHPVRIAKNNWGDLADYVADLARSGLRAIEVYHSDHSPENAAYYASLAKRFGLAATGGSDFHGANKPSIELGTGIRKNLGVPDEVLINLKLLAQNVRNRNRPVGS